jgi:hypothetical protein
VSPMARYVMYNNDGSGLRSNRSYFLRGQLPPYLHFLDIWNSFQLTCSAPNEFYPPQSTTIHCQPRQADKPSIFDTVLVETDSTCNDIKRTFISMFILLSVDPKVKVFVLHNSALYLDSRTLAFKITPPKSQTLGPSATCTHLFSGLIHSQLLLHTSDFGQ